MPELQELHERFRNVGIEVPEIYLPSEGVDWQAWAVVACDQYSSERDYWDKVKELVAKSPRPSTSFFPKPTLRTLAKKKELQGFRPPCANILPKDTFAQSAGDSCSLSVTRPMNKSHALAL